MSIRSLPHLAPLTLVALAGTGSAQSLSFAPPAPILENVVPVLEDSICADVSGDGILDVVFVGVREGARKELYLARGLGGRTYGAVERMARPGAVRSLPRLADVEGDGDTDLAVVSEEGELRLLRNDGGGAFTQLAVGAGNYDSIVSMADADADGDLDVFVQATTGEIVIGSIDPVLWTVTDSPSGVFDTLETAIDLNGDGRAELVSTETALRIHPAGPMGYGPPIVVSTFAVGTANRTNVLVVDLDGDGHLDLVPTGAVSQQTSPHAAYLGNGALAFAPAPLLTPAASDQPIGYERLVDANGDGSLDLLYWTLANGDVFDIRTHLSIGDGTLPFAEGNPLRPMPFDPQVRSAAQLPQELYVDLDGDGATDRLDVDLIRFGPLLAANPGWTPETSLANLDELPGPIDVAQTLDVDGDGTSDLVTLTTSPGRVQWQRNLGGLEFGTSARFSRAGDNVADFEVLGSSARPPVCLSVDGPAGVELQVWSDEGSSYALRSAVPTVATGILGAGDLDADGRTDVVTPAGFHSMDANLQLGPLQPILGLDAPGEFRFAVVDLDGDGDADILRWPRTGPLVIFRNLAGGSSFTPPLQLDFLSGASEIADVDGDGRLDLITADFQILEYRRGQGSLSFGLTETLATGIPGLATTERPTIIRAVDLDGDGDLDISLSNFLRASGPDETAWIQDSPATPPRFEPVFRETLVRAAGGFDDLDGDGDVDAFDVSEAGTVLLAENLLVPRTGSPFCEQPNANSTGSLGRLDVYGVPAAGGAPLRLVASSLPSNTFGFFVGSPNAVAPAPLANSEGFLCLGAGLGRYSMPSEIGATGAAGSIELAVAPDDLRTGGTQIAATAGLSWSFQAWHRDFAGGAASSNLTSGVTVTYE
ncbi:MAG: VCBS repeat-containing protein [Planctomycetota bacterium]